MSRLTMLALWTIETERIQAMEAIAGSTIERDLKNQDLHELELQLTKQWIIWI